MINNGNYTHFSYMTADGKRVASTVHDGHPNPTYWTVSLPGGNKFVPVNAKLKDIAGNNGLYPPKNGKIKRTRVLYPPTGSKRKPIRLTRTDTVNGWLSGSLPLN